MRRFLFLLVLAAAMPAAQVAHAAGNFAGVWTAAVCPRGVAAGPGRCAQFVLELYQKQNKLCGAHVFATPSADLVDEAVNPSAPSVSGDVEEDTATVSVASVRSKAPRGVEAELKLSHGVLLWKRVDKPGRDELIPATAQFTRSRHKTLMAPVFAQQLAAACSMIAIPDEPAPQEQPKETPQPPGNAPPPEPRNDS
jgi:hypothetical protein